jgi:hypothetical protein
VLAEPVSAVSSLAFVVAGAAIVALRRRGTAPRHDRGRARTTATYAALVAGIGVGSVIQHGPDPVWSDPAHDLPLAATVAFLAADAAATPAGRRRRWWWWAVPTVALLVVVVTLPRAGDLAQAAVAAVAVVLTVARARVVPEHRWAVAWALGLLAVGATIGTLSRTGGPLCDPDSLWQGHAAWHVLAAAALVVLAPVVGDPGRALAPDSAAPSARRSAAR